MIKKLYHISQEFLGNTVKFKPRIPESRSIYQLNHKYQPDNLDLQEDNLIKRICVSNTISGAITARCSEVGENYYVYSPKKIYSISRDLPELLVPDAHLTGERWILTPTIFKYIGKIICIQAGDDFKHSKWRWVK